MGLFKHPDRQSPELAAIVKLYEALFMDGEEGYGFCANFLADVEAIGYTFEFGLSAEPYDLKLIIPVKHWFSEPGLCREYYKHAETGKNYCLQDGGWFTVSSDPDYLEPDYPVSYAKFIDSKTGEEITATEES